jgi:hypothetical protein
MPDTNDQNLPVPKSIQFTREDFARLLTKYDPESVLMSASKTIAEDRSSLACANPESDVFKAMSLTELENGVLLSINVQEQYKSFVIDLFRKLKKEFQCETASEKSIAEVAAQNFIRILDDQRRMQTYLEKGSVSDTGVRYLAKIWIRPIKPI